MKVLIVESDASLRRALARNSRMCEADIVLVAGVREAIRELSRSGFDAVSVDLRAPRYQGMRLIETLRDRAPTLPLIATATSAKAEEMEKLANAAVHFVRKPYEPELILEAAERKAPVTPETDEADTKSSGDGRAWIADAPLKPKLRRAARKALEQDDFPILDERALDLQKRMTEDDCSIDGLVELFEGDIHITASILARANNAANRGSGSFTTLRDACVRIGTRETFGVALRTLMENTFPAPKEPFRSLMAEYWNVARLTAAVGRELGELQDVESVDELYVAGLMSHVGELFVVWLLSNDPKLIENETHATLLREVEVMGPKLGEALRTRWAIPQRLTALCDASRIDELGPLRAILHAAKTLAVELVRDGPEWVPELSESAALLGAIEVGEDEHLGLAMRARMLLAA